MNSIKTTNLQLSATEPKKKSRNKNKLSKQLEQERNHRNGDHREGYWRGVGGMEENVQGIRSINHRYKIDRGRLRTV